MADIITLLIDLNIINLIIVSHSFTNSTTVATFQNSTHAAHEYVISKV